MSTPPRNLRWAFLGTLALSAVGLVGVGMSAMGAPEDELAARDLNAGPGPDVGRQEMLRLLNRRERHLSEREKLVDKKEADLRAAQEEVEARLTELQALRDEIRGQLEGLDDDREKRITHLVKLFEAMRGKQAAAVLEETEEAVALEVLERMKKDSAGKVLAAMDPEKAGKFASVIGDAALTKTTP